MKCARSVDDGEALAAAVEGRVVVPEHAVFAPLVPTPAGTVHLVVVLAHRTTRR